MVVPGIIISCVLRRRGIPAGIHSLITAPYTTNTERSIKSRGEVSRFFLVKCDVRMNSRPYTFNACIDWVMGETAGKTDWGISLGEAKILEPDFADNVLVFAEALPLSTESEPLILKDS